MFWQTAPAAQSLDGLGYEGERAGDLRILKAKKGRHDDYEWAMGHFNQSTFVTWAAESQSLNVDLEAFEHSLVFF